MFQISADRSLVPSLPPASYNRCIVWMREGCSRLLTSLCYYRSSEPPSGLFALYSFLVTDNDAFPVEDSPGELHALVHDVVIVNSDKTHHDSLPLAFDSRLLKLESLKFETLVQPDSPAPSVESHFEGDDTEQRDDDEIKNDESGQLSRLATDDEDDDEDEEIDKDEDTHNASIDNNLPNENDVRKIPTTAQTQKKRKMHPDSPYRPSRPSNPRKRRKSTSPPALLPTSSLVIPEKNLFPPRSPVDASENNLLTWTGSRALTEVPSSVRSLTKIITASSTLVLESLRRFRLSNRYPTFGTSVDWDNFDIDVFGRSFLDFVEDMDGVDEDAGDEEEQQEFESDSLGIVSAQILCRVTEILLGVVRRDPQDKVYQFWERVARSLEKG